jgi:hypothetical protein
LLARLKSLKVFRKRIDSRIRNEIFGDWFLLKNPRLVWKIFQGKDQKAADRFYYDVDR